MNEDVTHHHVYWTLFWCSENTCRKKGSPHGMRSNGKKNKIFTEGERGDRFFNPKLNRSVEDNLQDFWMEMINGRGAYGILVP